MGHNLSHALGHRRLGQLPTHTIYESLEERRPTAPFAVGPASKMIFGFSWLLVSSGGSVRREAAPVGPPLPGRGPYQARAP